MFTELDTHGLSAEDAALKPRVIGAIATIVALCALLAFVPKHDPTKVVSATPCSILSEAEISAELGAPMVLMPTSGAVCRYVSTGTGTPTLFVVARHAAAIPPPIALDGIPVCGIGDAAVGSAKGLYVRYGARSYTFIIVAQTADGNRTLADEVRLAKLANRPLLAQNH